MAYFNRHVLNIWGALFLFLGAFFSLESLSEPREIGVIVAHKGAIRSLSFSQDGRWLLSNSEDGRARAWDMLTGELVRELGEGKSKKTAAISAAKFSPKANFVISAGAGGVVQIWDLHSGGLTKVVGEQGAPVTALDVSPDGEYIVSGGNQGQAILWRLSDASPLYYLEGHEGNIRTARFSPNGTFVATAGEGGEIRVWEVDTGYLAYSFKQTGRVHDVIFSSQEQFLIVAGEFLKLIDLRSGKTTQQFQGHEGDILSVDLHPSGLYLASASVDGSVRIWSTITGRSISELKKVGTMFQSVAFSPKGMQVAIGAHQESRAREEDQRIPQEAFLVTIWDVESIYPERAISDFVERGLYYWKRKGEFEKEAIYLQRMQSVDEKTGELFAKAYKRFSESVQEGAQLSRYNAEKEEYKVSLPALGEVTFHVPIQHAELFKEHFSELVFRNFVVRPRKGGDQESSWELEKVELYLPSARQSFHYNKGLF